MFNDAKNILALDKMFYCVLQMHKQQVLTGIPRMIISTLSNDCISLNRILIIPRSLALTLSFKMKQTVDNCRGPHK